MKKLFLPFFAVLMLFACEKDSTIENEQESAVYETGLINTRSKNKVNICHNGHIIRVSSNALGAHLKHGDIVEFGQLGTYQITYRIAGQEFIHEGEIIQSEDGSFSGFGQSITTGQEWILNGTIDSDGNYSFTLDYNNSAYFATATGVFECNGTGYSGVWEDSVNQTGTWTGLYISYN